MERLIDIRDMYKIYNPGENEVRALDGVSLGIDPGEFVAIVGHSGSGKSTLMNMLGCLDVPTSGEYYLSGEDVSKMKDDELSEIRNKRIGFIFQGFNLIPSLNAIENVELPLIYRGVGKGERRRLATEALERVGLGNRLTHRPMQMSGGQQQRVAIARAIAAKPPVILADEPTGNLDSKSGEVVMQILTELWQEGRTVVLITHDNSIAQSARRVVRISDGKVVEDRVQEHAEDAAPAPVLDNDFNRHSGEPEQKKRGILHRHTDKKLEKTAAAPEEAGKAEENGAGEAE